MKVLALPPITQSSAQTLTCHYSKLLDSPPNQQHVLEKICLMATAKSLWPSCSCKVFI